MIKIRISPTIANELADRLLEVAFPDPSCSWGSLVDSEDDGNEAGVEDAGGASVQSTPARAAEHGEVAAEAQVAATPSAWIEPSASARKRRLGQRAVSARR